MMIKWLKDYWYELASNYTDYSTINTLWSEIETNYSTKNRHYHNLNHLYNMFIQLEDIKSSIRDLDGLKFAIWYHDIIYKSTKSDNEERSADFAANSLKNLTYDSHRTEKVKAFILSTKKHQLIVKNDVDNAYLLDLDLSILGTDWKTYSLYTQNIRKEYKIYPNFIYNPGRKKVLNHFLERESLYFTDIFKIKFEKQARINLKKELEILN